MNAQNEETCPTCEGRGTVAVEVTGTCTWPVFGRGDGVTNITALWARDRQGRPQVVHMYAPGGEWA